MLDALFRILALTRKELLAILKDPRSRFSILIPPILQCLIYGYVATYDLNDVPYAVLDQDRSAASQKLLAGLDGSGVFQRVANLNRVADVKKMINERKALLVIQIDQDFEPRQHPFRPRIALPEPKEPKVNEDREQGDHGGGHKRPAVTDAGNSCPLSAEPKKKRAQQLGSEEHAEQDEERSHGCETNLLLGRQSIMDIERVDCGALSGAKA